MGNKMDELPKSKEDCALIVLGEKLPGADLEAKIRELEARKPQNHSKEIEARMGTDRLKIALTPIITCFLYEGAHYYCSTIEMLREVPYSSSLPGLVVAAGLTYMVMTLRRASIKFKETKQFYALEELKLLKNLRDMTDLFRRDIALSTATVYEVYHGNRERTEYSGVASSGLGEWFGTDNQEYAQLYGEVRRYRIELRNPYYMDFKEFRSFDRGCFASLEKSRKYREELEKRGFDGVIVTHHDSVKEYILFDKRMARITLLD